MPAARATGRLTLRSDAVVTNLEYDAARKKVTGVRYIDAKTGQAQAVNADLVFLCASAIASTQILMNSRAPGSDRSYFDNSGTLGRYVMDHIFRVGIDGDIPGHGRTISNMAAARAASTSRASATSAATRASASSAAMAIRAAPAASRPRRSASARR